MTNKQLPQDECPLVTVSSGYFAPEEVVCKFRNFATWISALFFFLSNLKIDYLYLVSCY